MASIEQYETEDAKENQPSPEYREVPEQAKIREELGIVIGNDPAMQTVWSAARKHARHRDITLVRGEAGSGKELVATAIGLMRREFDPEANGTLPQNIAAANPSTIESAIFGHKKGAFTGATEDRKGAFATVGSGTLFLDEIGDLDPDVQAKFLRVLSSTRDYSPLGSDKVFQFEGKVVAATNQPLEEMVVHGKFRKDLLDRLQSSQIVLPTLDERTPEHKIALIQHFLNQAAKEFFGRDEVTIQAQAVDALLASNATSVRELKTLVRNACFEALDQEATTVTAVHAGVAIASMRPPQRITTSNAATAVTVHQPSAATNLGATIENTERDTIIQALNENGWNRTQTAKALGISRVTLYNKMKKYSIKASGQKNMKSDASAASENGGVSSELEGAEAGSDQPKDRFDELEPDIVERMLIETLKEVQGDIEQAAQKLETDSARLNELIGEYSIPV